VYAGFVDGSVAVFDAESLWPRCRLSPSVHIPQGVSKWVLKSVPYTVRGHWIPNRDIFC
jgi:hypothetical protein